MNGHVLVLGGGGAVGRHVATRSTDETGREIWVLGREQSRATGAIAALAAHRVLSDPPANDLHHLHELTTLDEHRTWLAEHGITVAGST